MLVGTTKVVLIGTVSLLITNSITKVGIVLVSTLELLVDLNGSFHVVFVVNRSWLLVLIHRLVRDSLHGL